MVKKETKDIKVAVCGAGMGGLAVALGLARQGFQVSVYEQASEHRELGAGLWVSMKPWTRSICRLRIVLCVCGALGTLGLFITRMPKIVMITCSIWCCVLSCTVSCWRPMKSCVPVLFI